MATTTAPYGYDGNWQSLIPTMTGDRRGTPSLGSILGGLKHNACCGSGNNGGPTVDDKTLKTKVVRTGGKS